MLAIDFAALGDSLAQLPLHQLLGIEEEAFLGVEGANGTTANSETATAEPNPPPSTATTQRNAAGAADATISEPLTCTPDPAAGVMPGRDVSGAEIAMQPLPRTGVSAAADASMRSSAVGGEGGQEEMVGVQSEDVDLDELLGMVGGPAPSGGQAENAGRSVGKPKGGPSRKSEPEKPAETAVAPETTEDLESWLDSL